jgi:rRNA maturation RNase YbeY
MPNSKPSIRFAFLEGGSFTLTERNALKAFIISLFKKEKTAISDLQYIFCSDDYLLEINKQYLQHDYYTDIITFGLSGPGQPVEGEIYISVDRVRDNAANFGSTFKREMHRVIFHGALHLCGYKDKKKDEEITMRKTEDKYLKLYGL